MWSPTFSCSRAPSVAATARDGSRDRAPTSSRCFNHHPLHRRSLPRTRVVRGEGSTASQSLKQLRLFHDEATVGVATDRANGPHVRAGLRTAGPVRDKRSRVQIGALIGKPLQWAFVVLRRRLDASLHRGQDRRCWKRHAIRRDGHAPAHSSSPTQGQALAAAATVGTRSATAALAPGAADPRSTAACLARRRPSLLQLETEALGHLLQQLLLRLDSLWRHVGDLVPLLTSRRHGVHLAARSRSSAS